MTDTSGYVLMFEWIYRIGICINIAHESKSYKLDVKANRFAVNKGEFTIVKWQRKNPLDFPVINYRTPLVARWAFVLLK